MAKKAIIIVIILAVSGLGTYAGLIYNAAQNLKINVTGVELIDYRLPTILDLTSDIDLKIHAEISNPTGVTVSADQAKYKLLIDGVSFGEGVVGKFAASNVPSTVIITHNATNLNINAASVVANFIAGENVTLTIIITEVIFLGFPISMNISQEMQLNINQLM